MSYHFRPYVKDDINFIQNSWGHSYYKGSDYRDYVTPAVFHWYHRPIRERILNRPNAAVIVCAANEDPSLILGWIAVETPEKTQGMILHYLYVKAAFKGEKIGRELYKRAVVRSPVYISHMTNYGERIAKKKLRGEAVLYAPHLI